jgi:hypothetical protein
MLDWEKAQIVYSLENVRRKSQSEEKDEADVCAPNRGCSL